MSTDSQQKPDTAADCAKCGHMDYHHRPECGWRRIGYRDGTLKECSCRRFAANNDQKGTAQ